MGISQPFMERRKIKLNNSDKENRQFNFLLNHAGRSVEKHLFIF